MPPVVETEVDFRPMRGGAMTEKALNFQACWAKSGKTEGCQACEGNVRGRPLSRLQATSSGFPRRDVGARGETRT